MKTIRVVAAVIVRGKTTKSRYLQPREVTENLKGAGNSQEEK